MDNISLANHDTDIKRRGECSMKHLFIVNPAARQGEDSDKPRTLHDERRQLGTVGGWIPTLQHRERLKKDAGPPPSRGKLPLSPQH